MLLKLTLFISLFFVVQSDNLMSNFLVQNIQNALKLHQAGDVTAALPLYEQALSQKDSLTSSIVSTLASNTGAIYMSYGEYEKAAVKFEIAIEATPEKVESHYNYAIVLNSKLGDNSKALKHCIKAMKIDPNFYKAHHLMGNIMQDMGRPEKAEEYFMKAEAIAKSLGVEDPTVKSSSDTQDNAKDKFNLNSIWMFRSPEINKTYDISLPPSQQEKLGVSSLSITCLSTRPLLFEIPLLLTADECDHIKSAATPKLELSHVMGSKIHDQVGDKVDEEPYRSSYNAWLPLDSVLISLQERIALLTSIPLQYISLMSEELQVVKYESGGQFKMHHDSSSFKPRLLTALVYLQDSYTTNDIQEDSCINVGGETLFPFANDTLDLKLDDISNWSVDETLAHISKLPHDRVVASGVAVRPSQGKAIIFFNHRPDGTIDPLAIHSGSKVGDGTKWVANYWVALDSKALDETSVTATSEPNTV